MKKCGAALIVSLCFGVAMYGATAQRPSSPRGSMQECDRKQNNDSSKPFWDLVIFYNNASKDREKQKKISSMMQHMIAQSRSILSSCRSNFEVITRKDAYTFKECYPLMVATCIADDSDTGDPEQGFFEKVALLDTDLSHRQSIMLQGIRWRSRYIVKQMLCVGTDVTRALHIMKPLVDECESLYNEHCENYKNYEMLNLKDINPKNLIKLRNNLKKAYCLSQDKYKLLGITLLLLEKNLDLTGVAEDHPHFKDKECLGCQSIVERLRRQKDNLTQLYQDLTSNITDQQEQPGLPVCEGSSSSSSSSSFVPGSDDSQKKVVQS